MQWVVAFNVRAVTSFWRGRRRAGVGLDAGVCRTARAVQCQRHHHDDRYRRCEAGRSEWALYRGDRHITGTFTGSISAPFVITFDTNVPIATQSGRIHGRLIAGVYEANVTMASSTGATPVECDIPDGSTCIATPGGNFVPGLLLNGRMNFLSGAKGQGSVTGWLIPVLDDQGHIANILVSQLAISGQWMQ